MPSKRKYIVAGNWKMQGSRAQTQKWMSDFNDDLKSKLLTKPSNIDIFICPSYPYLDLVRHHLNALDIPIQLGAQDLSPYASGAYTGQVSGSMLADIGCSYVLVGHSERRQLCGESNDLVADKFFAAKRAGLTPILCVGETLAERQNNHTESLVSAQLNAILLREGVQAIQNAIIAYEPVWAIGTGKTATPQEAQEVHRFLRQWVAQQSESIADLLPIIYGGSVKASNTASLLEMPDIDGALVGGASLEAHEFLTICQSASSIR